MKSAKSASTATQNAIVLFDAFFFCGDSDALNISYSLIFLTLAVEVNKTVKAAGRKERT